MFFMDPFALLLSVAALLLALAVQLYFKSTVAKYSRVRSSSGMTGAQAAQTMLQSAGLAGSVQIEQVGGFLTDHYDPRGRVLRLSPDNYNGQSLAAVGVACHEAGHAVQHAKNYAPLALRNAIVPTATIGSNLSYVLIFLGLWIAAFRPLAIVGLALFATVVLFQIVNLPVEFDASRRARQMLPQLGIISSRQEASGVATMLNAAALTYVAATVTSLMWLLYYAWLIFGRRN